MRASWACIELALRWFKLPGTTRLICEPFLLNPKRKVVALDVSVCKLESPEKKVFIHLCDTFEVISCCWFKTQGYFRQCTRHFQGPPGCFGRSKKGFVSWFTNQLEGKKGPLVGEKSRDPLSQGRTKTRRGARYFTHKNEDKKARTLKQKKMEARKSQDC